MPLLNWLNKPYPFIGDFKTKFLTSFAFGLFIYLFLIIFKPFGIEDIDNNVALYLIGFGVITFFVLLFFFTILPLLFPKLFDLDEWNIGKEISFILLNVIIITFLNNAYDSFAGQEHIHQHDIQFFIPVTIAVGIIPITILIFFSEIYLREKHQKSASRMSSTIQTNRITVSQSNKEIKIVSESGNDSLHLHKNNLLFIKSSDNYCKIFHLENNAIQTQLIRVTLKNIEKQLDSHPDIIRCHRSYIVNKNSISRLSGNARAYNVHFENCEETAAISRSFSKDELF